MVQLMSAVPSVSNLSGSSSGFPGPVSPVSGQEEKQCRYPAGNNNMTDPVMNYAASLATASSPGTNIAAAAHFYQQQVNPVLTLLSILFS